MLLQLSPPKRLHSAVLPLDVEDAAAVVEVEGVEAAEALA